jgi:hypothetical protein
VDPEVKLVHHSDSVLMGEMASSQPAIYSIQFMSASRPILNIQNLNPAFNSHVYELVLPRFGSEPRFEPEPG